MNFYDMQILSNFSIGENKPAELAKFAEKLGWKGIVIADYYQGKENFLNVKKAIDDLQKNSNIEIYQGVTIKAANKNELAQTIGKVRNNVLSVIVHGGDYSVNRSACEDSRVDMLIHPELNRADPGLDEASVDAAFKNNVTIGISFRNILHRYRRVRSFVLQNIARNINLIENSGVKLIICSGAYNVWEMRDPRQLIAIGDVLGLDLHKAFATVAANPLEIIQKNKKILSGERVTKGVEVAE